MDSETEETVDAPVDLSDGCPFCGESVTTGDDFRCGSCFARFTGKHDHAYPLWGPFGSTEKVSTETVSAAFVDSTNDGEWISAGSEFFDDDMR